MSLTMRIYLEWREFQDDHTLSLIDNQVYAMWFLGVAIGNRGNQWAVVS